MMKKRLMAALCAAVLCLALAPNRAQAVGETVYHLALNDRFADEEGLNAATMPVSVGGTVYIPYTAFDRRATNVNLGVFYAQQDGMLTLYDKDKRLRFDVVNNLCIDESGNLCDFRAITRNGKIYVPYSAVCNFFGLSSYYQPTEDCGVLIRITNGSEVLTNAQFFPLAVISMRIYYNRYMQTLSPQVTPPPSASPSPSPSPSPAVSPQPSQTGDEPEDDIDRSEVRVYLAFRCGGDRGLEEIVSTLAQSGVQALFFFRPEELAARTHEIRALVGAGHAVGLLVAGETADEAHAALSEGNRLLERIAWTRTHTALVENGTAAVTAALETRGWRCWQENVDGIPTGDRATVNAARVMRALDAKRVLARVTMDESPQSALALAYILAQLREENYTIRLAVETEL